MRAVAAMGAAGRAGLSVDASWLDATGADGGVACLGGSLVSARFVTPAGGAFGASGVVDASGAVAPHVVVEPGVATPPAGETDGRDVLGDSTDKSPANVSSAAGDAHHGAHGKSLAETRGHDNQDNNDSNQGHGVHAVQVQTRHRGHFGAPQDRRQQLDRRLCGAFPTGDSAVRCSMLLLRPRLSETRGEVKQLFQKP